MGLHEHIASFNEATLRHQAAKAELRAVKAEKKARDLRTFQENVHFTLLGYSEKLGEDLVGTEPECWRMLDKAVNELVWRRSPENAVEAIKAERDEYLRFLKATRAHISGDFTEVRYRDMVDAREAGWLPSYVALDPVADMKARLGPDPEVQNLRDKWGSEAFAEIDRLTAEIAENQSQYDAEETRYLELIESIQGRLAKVREDRDIVEEDRDLWRDESQKATEQMKYLEDELERARLRIEKQDRLIALIGQAARDQVTLEDLTIGDVFLILESGVFPSPDDDEPEILREGNAD